MSRVGRMPIAVPSGVEVEVEDRRVRVKGPRGELARELPRGITLGINESQVTVAPEDESRVGRSLWGLSRTLVKNMVDGVSQGFEKHLELVGVGYRAAKQGNKLVLTVGYSHPVEILPPPGLEVEVPAPNRVVVRGADKEKVGDLAARIRRVREPEPYKGKGIRYAGEKIRTKAGKAGKAGKAAGGKGKK
ncbi:MAG: 50S ribosomal protein L6 [Clostridia bacterium]|nr:MAG: 50S ribosomal protein L6 [Clostridia bacterium]